jgi:two-component system, sensor histidine kinase
MLKAYYYFLLIRADLAVLALVVGLGALFLRRYLLRRGPHYRLPRKSFILAGLLVLVGGVMAEWASRYRTAELEQVFAGFAPTYAADLAHQGHALITLETKADDPRYLELIEMEKTWLAANPIIADVYTFRRDDQGKVRLIVDSETDYDHSGKIDAEREQRTPIGEVYAEATPAFYDALDGKAGFETEIMLDRWGIWVSSFAPIFDHAGKVEAAVGIDYPADRWLSAIGTIRAVYLGIALGLIVLLLASSTIISFSAAEIEERKKAQKRLEEISESALSASAAKSEFLSLMSHEVRTPLSAILGFATILADTPLDAKQRRYAETINRAGTGLLGLLNNILDYNRAESGKLALERIAWAPALLIHEVMELMVARAEEKKLQLNFDNRLPAALTVYGDPTRIRQILLNLVTNAIKFTEHGSVTVTAQWQVAAEKAAGGEIHVAVSDTGAGIAPDRLPELFQAYAQADASTTRLHGGTGLGLAICKRLSDLMGGRLELESTLGKGTTINFALHCELVSATPSAPGNRGAVASVPVWGRVLAIDDAKLNRELLKVMLRRLGLEADVAASGPEGASLAAAHAYAIIFTDLEMPEMDGFETARQIRTQEGSGLRVPIVAVSAMTTAGTREKCIAAGMDDYLIKPVYLPALASVVDVLLPRQSPATGPNSKNPNATVQPATVLA